MGMAANRDRAATGEARSDGRAFEKDCARTLAGQGWAVQFTAVSGDQGVDLIGRKGGVKVAFQCKDYAGQVGNSAVQQVLAGKQFIAADRAAVVAPQGYTTSARQLAARVGVLLLSPRDLLRADRLFGIRSTGNLKLLYKLDRQIKWQQFSADPLGFLRIAWRKASKRPNDMGAD